MMSIKNKNYNCKQSLGFISSGFLLNLISNIIIAFHILIVVSFLRKIKNMFKL